MGFFLTVFPRFFAHRFFFNWAKLFILCLAYVLVIVCLHLLGYTQYTVYSYTQGKLLCKNVHKYKIYPFFKGFFLLHAFDSPGLSLCSVVILCSQQLIVTNMKYVTFFYEGYPSVDEAYLSYDEAYLSVDEAFLSYDEAYLSVDEAYKRPISLLMRPIFLFFRPISLFFRPISL